MRNITVIGHRGAAGLEPENTVRSFRRAVALGVDRVETDVHLTRDGYLVCIHDADVDRTTNGSGPIAALTLDEAKRLDAGLGERIPTLEEAIDAVRGRAVLQIELKGAGTPRPTLAAIEAAGLSLDEVLLSSFDTVMLRDVHSLRPDLVTSHLFGSPPPDAASVALSVGAKGMSVSMRHITPDLVRSVHEAGLEIRAYNPDLREEMEHFIEMGVDGLGTNRPDILLELLRERGAR